MVPRRAPIFYNFFDNFLTIFWSTFGTMLRPILVPDLPKRDQDEPKMAIRIFIEPKTYIYKKMVFALDCRHFFTLEASQESLKRPNKAPKRHQKSSKTPTKKSPKLDPKINKFQTNFWSNFGSPSGNKKKNKNKNGKQERRN